MRKHSRLMPSPSQADAAELVLTGEGKCCGARRTLLSVTALHASRTCEPGCRKNTVNYLSFKTLNRACCPRVLEKIPILYQVPVCTGMTVIMKQKNFYSKALRPLHLARSLYLPIARRSASLAGRPARRIFLWQAAMSYSTRWKTTVLSAVS